MANGIVKWFDVKKGFGFIVGPEGQDVFVHFSSIGGDGFKTLKDGEPVEYELHQGEKGFHARAVHRLGSRLSQDGDDAAVETAETDGDAITVAAPSLRVEAGTVERSSPVSL